MGLHFLIFLLWIKAQVCPKYSTIKMWICIFFLPKEKKNLKCWYLFLQARSKWNKVLGHTNTHWIHVVDWWLWKCRIISKVHTWFKHTVQIGQKTKHLLVALRHLQRHLHLPRCSETKISGSASVEPFHWSYLHQHWGCPQGRAGGFRPRRGTSASPRTCSGYSAFINMYKSITGTLKCLWLE